MKKIKTNINLSTGLKALVVAGFLISTSCSTVSVIEKNSSRTIVQKRDNVVTSSQLSNKSASILVSVGVSKQDCFSNFKACLTSVDKTILDKNNRESLALYAELYLAHAKLIKESEDCIDRIMRPPIDPYYANAPLSPTEKADEFRYLAECNSEYRASLLNAVKYSYAYLFYPQLNPQAQSSTTQFKKKPGNLPTDLDIQTIDVYDAATDLLIKQLYSNKDNSQYENKITSYIKAGHVSDTKNTLLKSSGEQIKVLNLTFPPLSEDDSFKEYYENKEVLDKITNDENNFNVLDSGVANSETTYVDLYLPNEPEYLKNSDKFHQSFDELYASHDLSFSGLNTVVEREGFGISYVTLFDDRVNTSIVGLLTSSDKKLNSEDPVDRIHLTGNLLMTGVLIPEGQTLDEVLQSNKYDLKFYNPHHTESIKVLGETYSLAANFSSSYGLWLAENNLSNVGYFNLLAKQQTLTLPQLYMLEPYDPNKRIIIMLHGLASSPATWVSVTNDISNDTELRDNYQVWQIFYPTNIPILENRYRIQELIEKAYELNDPNREHIASQHSVLIGHSMGAVISRLLVSNDNLENNFEELSKGETNRRLSKLLNDQFNQLKVKNRLHLQQLDSVDTAVFISAPFRGTDFADRWFTRLLRNIVQLPFGFAQTIAGNLTSIASEGELVSNPLGALYFENGASQMSDNSSFMKLTSDLNIADNVTYHSIIANRDSDLYQGLLKLKITEAPNTQLSSQESPETVAAGINLQPSLDVGESSDTEQNTDAETLEALDDIKDDIAQSVTPQVSDGIVPYSSSHLEGAATETLISGGHGIHESPEAILTLRKILHSHLEENPVEK